MKISVCALGMLLFCGCSGGDSASSKSAAQSDTIRLDSVNAVPAAIKLDTAKRKSPLGIYTNVRPCVNCKGKSYTIGFYADSSFVMEEYRTDNIKVVTRKRGSWKFVNNEIRLYGDERVTGRYIWKEDTLVRTDLPGGTIDLERKPAASENKVWQRRGDNGAEFFGIGNEPFWNIEIDEQKEIAFQLADWDEPLRLKPSVPMVSPDSISYKLSTDSTSLQVTIYNSFCSDGMSDYIYENAVEVKHDGQVYRGCGIFYK